MGPRDDSADVALVVAIAGGDRAALSSLYERHGPLLLALARQLLRDAREAEDLLHDVFLEVWQKASSYDPRRASVRTWLVLRLRSRALDRCRSARVTRSVPLEDSPLGEPIDDGADPSASPDRRAVRRALAALPESQRDVLRLAYFRGMSSSEIAQELEIPLGTVKSRVAAGLRGLRSNLDAGQGGGA